MNGSGIAFGNASSRCKTQSINWIQSWLQLKWIESRYTSSIFQSDNWQTFPRCVGDQAIVVFPTGFLLIHVDFIFIYRQWSSCQDVPVQINCKLLHHAKWFVLIVPFITTLPFIVKSAEAVIRSIARHHERWHNHGRWKIAVVTPPAQNCPLFELLRYLGHFR